jgi:hypothetical protein
LTKDFFAHWIGDPFALEDHQYIYLCLTISCGEPIRIEELLASPV